MAIKHARDNVRRRVLAPPVLERFRTMIQHLEPRIAVVMQEEFAEKQVRSIGAEQSAIAASPGAPDSVGRQRRGGVCGGAVLRSDLQLNRAEGELKRAENMIVHHDEIKARPARTWFQSATEKLASKGWDSFAFFWGGGWPGLRRRSADLGRLTRQRPGVAPSLRT